MPHQNKLVVLTLAGLSAPLAQADSLEFSDFFLRNGPSNIAQGMSQDAWLMYVGGFTGPSNVAFGFTSLVRAEANLSHSLHLMLAGPGNTSRGTLPSFDVSTDASGDGPGVPGGPTSLTTSDMIGILQPQDAPDSITRSASAPTPTGTGGFQVVVPLPGAGALAAGGLAIVAFRRRR